MTETSSESTPHSPDTINVLPILSEATAPVSLTLTIDKSVSKIAGWLIAVLLATTGVSCICLTALVLVVANSKDREEAVNNRQQVSENHWRNLEVDQRADRTDIDKLKEELSNADRRR